MTFKNYSDLAEPLELPIGDKVYRIPAIGIADGIRLQEVLDPANEQTIDDDEFRRVLLGTALDEMLADNIPGPAVVRAALTALADFQRGRATAEVMWETGGDPKALEAYVTATMNRAQRRSRSTGAAKKTPSRASTTGTRKSPAK